MKFSAILSLAVFPAIAYALTTSYDTTYDNASQSLATVACSDGPNGLLTRGFTTFSSLPHFPNIGGVPAIQGWNSPSCGTCWKLSYTDGSGVTRSVNILGVDVAVTNFNIGLNAMNTLTGNQAQFLGRVPITATQVPSSVCGL
ncbi:hypothetical protein CVT25_008926 [Psilocybe cyanescens]|uniref:Cerato-platanin n=1 Tax=Psilocybe cyanescens TaxID=93625 RepID=A0A409XND5_PSICY|nr:hypothetical protein CVT25_008926 [Psilocybe cyanescens]